jgi:DNA-binding response OmpR family regulator
MSTALNVSAVCVDTRHVPDVLIVDDDPDIRGMLSFTLADLGFDVREAKDGNDALDELAETAPDCMVLDLMMPNLDGFSVLEIMRAKRLAPTTAVVILTCKADERALVRGWELGAVEFLTKPIDPYVLASKIAAIVASAEQPAGRQPS